jgi:hypothetical protein
MEVAVAFEFDFDETFKWCAMYLAKGLRIVRLHGIWPDGRCTCGDPECRVGGSKQKNCGKHPVGLDWGSRWARDEDDILGWDDGKPFNVGVVLGPEGGVIDNEDDSPEATAFRQSLGLHELITPSWTSGKSTHQLTRWHDSLAGCQGVLKPGGLECRLGSGGRQIQSVLPPSWHNSGVQYKWKPDLSIDDVDVAETPRVLLLQIVNNGDRPGSGSSVGQYVGPLVFREVHDGQGRHQALLLWAWNRIVNERFPLSAERRPVLTQEILDANLKYIKPPKTNEEALKIINSCFEHYRRKEEKGWSCSPDDAKPDSIQAEAVKVQETVAPEDAVPVVGLEQQGLEPYQVGKVMGYRVGSWRIEMVQGDPPEIVLVVPQWQNTACRGRVHMSLDTFRSAAKVAAAVFNATRRVILDGDSKKWVAVWKGMDASKATGGASVPGIMEQLMSRKTLEDDIQVGTSSLRYAQLAGYVLQVFRKATQPKDEDKPEPNESGRPCWVTPDELWLQWGKIWEDIGRSHSDVTPGERNKIRTRLLDLMGVKDFEHRRHRFQSGRLEYVVFTRDWVEALEMLAAGEGRPVRGDGESDFSKTENHSPSTVHAMEVLS